MTTKDKDRLKKSAKRGRKPHQPARETVPYPAIFRIGSNRNDKKPLAKSTPRMLRQFSYYPLVRRAINFIKNQVAALRWEISPIEGVDENGEIKRQTEVATYCFNHPNADDSFRLMIEQVIEEYCVAAGAIEVQLSGDELRPLWMFPVDGTSIKIFPNWKGDPGEPRYAQGVSTGIYTGNATEDILLRNDELIYIRPNPSAANPYGKSPLEIVFDTVAAKVGVADLARKTSTNQKPNTLLDLGDCSPEELYAYRSYWENEIENEGKMPIFGTAGSPGDVKGRGMAIHRLYPEGDAGMYLKYQEFLIREIATGFDISPQNLAVEADVNRSTAEVSFERDWQSAIKPLALNLAEYFTREALHRRLGFYSLRFTFPELELADEISAKVYTAHYTGNVVTPNERRAKLGMKPLDNAFADMLFVETQIAIQAARGAAQVDDQNLSPGSGGKEPSPKGDKKKGKDNGGRSKEPDAGKPGSGGKRKPSEPEDA